MADEIDSKLSDADRERLQDAFDGFRRAAGSTTGAAVPTDELPEASTTLLDRLFRGRPTALTDSDRDGLTDAEEGELGTDPHARDSDRDGVSDAWEVYGDTDPLDPDTDDDGLTDGEEWVEPPVTGYSAETEADLADDGDDSSGSDTQIPIDEVGGGSLVESGEATDEDGDDGTADDDTGAGTGAGVNLAFGQGAIGGGPPAVDGVPISADPDAIGALTSAHQPHDIPALDGAQSVDDGSAATSPTDIELEPGPELPMVDLD
jgi:hypothetical protein